MKPKDLNKIIFAASVSVLVLVSGWGYFYVVVSQKFLIKTTINCDPAVEACFYDSQSFYKYTLMSAEDYGLCSARDDCYDFCRTGNCRITYCTEDEVEEGETCTGPEEFNI
ncbi:MAG: hypothetical protein A2589_00125 [Candidatus Vogelbacteria bacterium RIFOXYD1_FULL_46_19]|uniref:Uncharacterized protein n=1 Tax=Candidatus Vogelbacteria bacterium RIFOXYD1_FULL_46_19 TaxID=1802439 RepID=A0A1G2QJC2_9BACT|nr:MAG: hypothetical protein A2589_00125 [Candidatus Vogelbacteria bacterium RIFOXYD1_FULL_46_19]